MAILNKLSTKKHLILSLLGFFLHNPAVLSMNPYPERSQASCSYAQENTVDQRVWLTPDIVKDYMAQLKKCVIDLQKNPLSQEALNTLSDLYFYAQFPQESDKETAIENISPIIDTLVARNNDQALSELAYIFVGTRHAQRINQFIQERMAARNASGYLLSPAALSGHEQPPYRSTARVIEDNDMPTTQELRAIEQDASPSAPPYELGQDNDLIITEITQAAADHNIDQLLALAHRHPELEYASLINDTIAELTQETEEAQTSLNPHHNQELQAPQAAAQPAFIPEAHVIENREAPLLNRNRLTAATLLGGSIIGLYLWHRYTKNSH